MLLCCMLNTKQITLTSAEREELMSRLRARSLRAEDVRRARLLIMLADDQSYLAIRRTLGCNANYISRWKQRFLEDGFSCLYSRHQGRKIQTLTPKLEAKILTWTRRKPSSGSTHWSTRQLAKELGISHMMVARVWAKGRTATASYREIHGFR